jgi:hypothetical protein
MMTIRQHAEAFTGKRWEDMTEHQRANWIAWGILTIGGDLRGTC